MIERLPRLNDWKYGESASPCERRDVAGDVAAHPGVLDLDDLGAEVGEDLGAEGPGAELGDGEDSNAVERRAPLADARQPARSCQ